MNQQQVKLRPDQTAFFKAQCDRIDGMAEGYRLGLQEAKKLALQMALAIPEPKEVQDGNPGH